MRRVEHVLSDFQVPETQKIECRLLQSVIVDSAYLGELLRIVKPEFFSNDENRKIWGILVDMYNSRTPIDMSAVFAKVERKYFIDNIISAEPSYGQAVLQLGAILMDAYVKREAYFSAVGILQSIEKGETADTVTGQFANFKDEVVEHLRDDSMKNASELANQFAESLQSGKPRRITAMFPTLNYMTYGGFGAGNLVILAARPSVGKTTIALQLAQNASRCGHKVGFFSLEMTSDELIQRLIVGTGKISQLDIVTQNIDWSRFELAVQEAINANLFINDKAKSIDEICTKITLEAQAGNINIAFVDYLGLIKYRENRGKTVAQQIGDLTTRFKNVAKECGIPVVLLCQLNRESAKEARAPQLTDLRDSGSIEQDADIVMMLDRHKDDMGEIVENEIDLWVRKNRGGKCNFDSPIHLKGNDSYSAFYEVTQSFAPVYEPEPQPVQEDMPNELF